MAFDGRFGRGHLCGSRWSRWEDGGRLGRDVVVDAIDQDGLLGSVLNVVGTAGSNALQRIAVEESRLMATRTKNARMPRPTRTFTADLTRGLAGGKPWLLMEHSTSAVQWQPRNIAKTPGEMARNTLAHLARGADGVMFFQWRQSAVGPEKWHSAMVPHGGEDTRIWQETKALGNAVAGLADVAGSTCPPAQIGLLLDYEATWALELTDRPSADLAYGDALRSWLPTPWRSTRPAAATWSSDRSAAWQTPTTACIPGPTPACCATCSDYA